MIFAKINKEEIIQVRLSRTLYARILDFVFEEYQRLWVVIFTITVGILFVMIVEAGPEILSIISTSDGRGFIFEWWKSEFPSKYKVLVYIFCTLSLVSAIRLLFERLITRLSRRGIFHVLYKNGRSAKVSGDYYELYKKFSHLLVSQEASSRSES